MINKDSNERRRTERVPLSEPQPLNTKAGEKLYLVSISSIGAEITCPEKLDYDGVIDLSISLPTKIHILSLSGNIIWQKMKNRWHAGVAFLPMPDADKQIIRVYIDYIKQDNELRCIRKTLTTNLQQLATNLDSLHTLLERFIRAKQTPDEQKSRYFH
jgi:hypothetical protein